MHLRRRETQPLTLALALVLAFAVVEAVAGAFAGSLALLADAGHMAADAGALAVALFAAWLARRPATPRRSFGWRRAEILAALANGLTLVGIALLIIVEAARRLSEPPDVTGGLVLVVGGVGLVVNIVTAQLLHPKADSSLNMRVAFRHVLADLVSSAGVIVAALVLLVTGWAYVDPLISVGIGLLVLVSAWSVLRESLGILLEATPDGIDSEEVGRSMAAVAGVLQVHDLHIWTITTGFPALSAHVLVEPAADCHEIRRALDELVRERFSLAHSTLQVEHASGKEESLQLGVAGARRTPLV